MKILLETELDFTPKNEPFYRVDVSVKETGDTGYRALMSSSNSDYTNETKALFFVMKNFKELLAKGLNETPTT
jgi:hypothetical protein